MPHAVIGLIGVGGGVLAFVIFGVTAICTEARLPKFLVGASAVVIAGSFVFYGVSLKNTKEYPDATIMTKSAVTVDELCKQQRPAWYVHTCRQQIFADNEALVGMKLIPAGTRVFVNGFNNFQWNM